MLLLGVGALVVVLLCLARWLWRRHVISTADSTSDLPLPPGDVGLPFIGEMLSLAISMQKGLDFFSERLQRYGRVYKTHVMGRPTVRVVGAANIRRVLMADASTAVLDVPATIKRLLGPRALTTSTGHWHKSRRRETMKAFSTQALTGYAVALNRIIKEETSDWLGRRFAFDVVERLAVRSAWEVLVGLRHFHQVGAEIVHDFDLFLKGFWTLPIPVPGTTFYKAEAANRRLMRHIVAEYRKRQADDFEPLDFHDALTLILTKDEEQGTPLSEEDVTSIIREMLFAGHSTLSSAATSVIMYLAQNPRVMKKLRQELTCNNLMDEESELTYDKVASLTYLGDVISETLRLAPPVGGGYRKAMKTFEIGGYQIPKSWAIIWSIFDTHEVSDLYENDRAAFTPERWTALRNNPDLTYNHVPFGAGARACVGKQYAKLLLRILTAQLVRKYDWELENNDVIMVRLPVRQPKDRLPVVFRTRLDTEGRHLEGHFNENNNYIPGKCAETAEGASMKRHHETTLQ